MKAKVAYSFLAMLSVMAVMRPPALATNEACNTAAPGCSLSINDLPDLAVVRTNITPANPAMPFITPEGPNQPGNVSFVFQVPSTFNTHGFGLLGLVLLTDGPPAGPNTPVSDLVTLETVGDGTTETIAVSFQSDAQTTTGGETALGVLSGFPS